MHMDLLIAFQHTDADIHIVDILISSLRFLEEMTEL